MQTIATAVRAGNLSAIDTGLIVNRLSKIIAAEPKQINRELNRRLAMAERNARYSDKIEPGKQKPANAQLGQGLSATAQREILEVLLNEPELFETIKQKITAEDFDVPILKQIATILFETLTAEPEASLAQILAGAESIEASACLVELARCGEEKGNFKPRLTGALKAIQQYQARKSKTSIKEIEDQTRFLQRVHENTAKEDRHNVGMT